MSRYFLISLVGVLLSCTILEEEDVTSADDLSSLKLASIQITETLNSGVSSKTASATETIINETLSNGITITKRRIIVWPTLTNLQFRSGATSDIKLVTEYLKSGKIKFWRVISAQDTLETYEFKYNQNGILNFLVTKIKDKTTKQIIVDDTDQYSLDSFNFPSTRNLNGDPTKKNKGVWFGDKITVNSCGFSFVWQYNMDCSTTCVWLNKKEYNNCGAQNFYVVNQNGNPGGTGQFDTVDNGILLEEVYFGEEQSNGSCCADQYYFHPYLFMSGDIRIKMLYAIDWWKENVSFNGNTKKDVRIKFNYEK